jgi:hypothetical protein
MNAIGQGRDLLVHLRRDGARERREIRGFFHAEDLPACSQRRKSARDILRPLRRVEQRHAARSPHETERVQRLGHPSGLSEQPSFVNDERDRRELPHEPTAAIEFVLETRDRLLSHQRRSAIGMEHDAKIAAAYLLRVLKQVGKIPDFHEAGGRGVLPRAGANVALGVKKYDALAI